MPRKKVIYYRDWEQMPLSLTVAEVAVITKLTEQSVRKHAREQTIPATKLGKSWRFNKEDVRKAVEGGVC